ncbi:MAG TPA: DUF72 domain-containing protein, partial [Tepidisphaeraceae bacterium]|nr:DUF72 domain-containing protein [Tepidisphaeraceae bacterium]
PPPGRAARWADVVPADFRFCAKVPKQVTHELPTALAVREFHAFVDAMRPMGEKLAAVLLQFAPSFGIDAFDKVKALLAEAPPGVRVAVEFRDRSWGTSRTLDLLRRHNAALVAAEYTTLPRVVHATSDFLYVRWIGEHDRFPDMNAEKVDMSDRLKLWREKIAAAEGGPVTDVYGFFNNDYAGYAVATCETFKRMLGLPVGLRDVPPAGGLFG